MEKYRLALRDRAGRISTRPTATCSRPSSLVATPRCAGGGCTAWLTVCLAGASARYVKRCAWIARYVCSLLAPVRRRRAPISNGSGGSGPTSKRSRLRQLTQGRLGDPGWRAWALGCSRAASDRDLHPSSQWRLARRRRMSDLECDGRVQSLRLPCLTHGCAPSLRVGLREVACWRWLLERLAAGAGRAWFVP